MFLYLLSCCLPCAGLICAIVVIYKLLDKLIRLPKLGYLSSRYILITGCGSGFGFELAKRLDSVGCHVIAGCHSEKGEYDLRKQCSSRLKTIVLDVADHKSVLNAYDEVKKMLPQGDGLWGVVNNAGISGKISPADWLSLKDYTEVSDVNLLGLIDVTMTFLPLVKKARGRIVNCSSDSGRFSNPFYIPYCISKYGVEAFSDGLRRQISIFHVSVHIVEPGFFKTKINDTGRLEALYRQAWEEASDEVKAVYGEEYVVQSIKMGKKFVDDIASDRISDVVDAYEHALLGLFPRGRYVVGLDAYLTIVLQALPEWFSDNLILLMSRGRPEPTALKVD